MCNFSEVFHLNFLRTEYDCATGSNLFACSSNGQLQECGFYRECCKVTNATVISCEQNNPANRCKQDCTCKLSVDTSHEVEGSGSNPDDDEGGTEGNKSIFGK